MPKLKTKSGVKKRFRLTASGKVRMTQANKRHCMVKRSNRQLREQRGTTIAITADGNRLKRFMPYGLKGRSKVSSKKNSVLNQLRRMLMKASYS